MKAGFGKEPAFIREGGSIGAVVTMQQAWKVPILFMGLSLPEHGYHAPNEYFDWGQASGGMKAFAHYFAEVAKMEKRGWGWRVLISRARATRSHSPRWTRAVEINQPHP